MTQTSASLGDTILAHADELASFSDMEGGLTCAYLTPAHRAAQALLAQWMEAAGMQVRIDAIGNVIGRYAADPAVGDARVLLTGSHFDTVRNGGRYDGRLGILLPIAVLGALNQAGIRLPYHVDVVAFAEEEGLRFKTSFLASSVLAGRFDAALLERQDADGITLREALAASGLPGAGALQALRDAALDPASLLGFVEVHIEQGPVLLHHELPLGVVTQIAGSSRFSVRVEGLASHAGTTPMGMRRDAAAGAAEMILLVEQRCAAAPTLVGTVGQLQVPDGSSNVIPAACTFSMDIRAGEDAIREAAIADIVAGIAQIAERRGLSAQVERVPPVNNAPCARWLMDQFGAVLKKRGLQAFELPSGAGHDAMMMQRVTDVAMLFVRCGNGGISHNPLETITSEDAQLAAEVFVDFLRHFQPRG
ncbi:putative N-carbamoyl-L-amino-acid hydrolase; Amidase, hydantoinase/carbamoylase family; putative exported protein [Cupriavidus taiwanensis]|uniref:N-carbamoyl-L-amino-acid hydrolase Amidase, hydantoinase/carbamoylase family putative exported protein n=1 Tax=Cupriavidus taiwanensis TaxID=164546 RepID=A0A976ATZ4_9BURK|nr:Zn-dependent hydrolase [Cupriavidus taiwanensis]SOZ50625.1 putative N-carbamoyl-L-amino-acid hydrolase; Amidase, hydantoinase/carbamoylase family; putative exported protein [Cupriavidus taiwanensis]SOZ52055.1 putative N-carbamoyl-L-amino-acid hydrolase; Amidase, hydantoinase/carbamoylase family; putative exported protein [Cupriavidus taiwanensis]SOZ54490.1 putative N-carbamoyl-L-amino-acid hydrolase; Amidase, hydantoinase/carbamoylase family; putative exported protein [Cupriavidus taiwanensis